MTEKALKALKAIRRAAEAIIERPEGGRNTTKRLAKTKRLDKRMMKAKANVEARLGDIHSLDDHDFVEMLNAAADLMTHLATPR